MWRLHADAACAAEDQATNNASAWPRESEVAMMQAFDSVMVFSATKAQERQYLGQTISDWLHAHKGITVVDKVVSQSSDSAFHCVVITLFYNRAR